MNNELATCLTEKVNPSVFFPSNEEKRSGPAKAVCCRCPVRQQCLDAAIARGERCGIWGGLTTKERKPLAIAAGTWNFGRWTDDEAVPA
jgi:WhiB family redox-sensing transcriptional regulator